MTAQTVTELTLIGAAAMAMPDAPLKLPGVSDPASRTAADRASDAIPHPLYGAGHVHGAAPRDVMTGPPRPVSARLRGYRWT
jgi:hypothetical protein